VSRSTYLESVRAGVGDASHTVSAALRARRWSLAALAAQRGGPAPRATAVADIPAAVWRLVLHAECAALPVLRALPERGAVDPAVHAALFELSLPELQRCMTVGAQLRDLDALAVRHGLQPVVLKGGVNVARGRELDLGDLDVYLPPDEATRLAELVDHEQYQRAPLPDGPRHLARRYASHQLPLEIHHSLAVVAARPEDVLAGASTLPGYQALRVLAPRNHAWHVLHHCIDAHTRRQGMLRDVIALGLALDHCTDDDLRDLESKAQAHRRSERMMAMLRVADDVRSGRAIDGPAHERFDQLAAGRYALADAKFDRWLSLGPAVYNAAFTALDPDTSFFDVARMVWPVGPVKRWYTPSQGPVLRSAALAAGKVAKIGYRACAVSIGASIAAVASRSIRRSARDLTPLP
jgi:hypothetical protein